MAADPVTGVLDLGKTLLNKFVKDKDLAAKLEHDEEMQVLVQELQSTMGQLEINRVEAAHKSLFVAGWRPFIGWVCGIALLYNTLLNPFFSVWFAMPTVDPGLLYPVLMGILGLGGMRSFEKSRGVQRER